MMRANYNERGLAIIVGLTSLGLALAGVTAIEVKVRIAGDRAPATEATGGGEPIAPGPGTIEPPNVGRRANAVSSTRVRRGGSPAAAGSDPPPAATPAIEIAPLEHRLSTEPVDEPWASANRDRLAAIIRGVALEKTWLDRVECAATICRIDLQHEVPEDRARIERELRGAIGWQAVVTEDAALRRTSIYVA